MIQSIKPMRPPKLYLETSVWSHLFADDTPAKREITEAFFREIEEYGCAIFISALVNDELDQTPDSELREQLRAVVKKFHPRVIELVEEAIRLAEHYVSAGIIPQSAENDALHIAQASVEGLDVIVSWNMRHMVRLKTRQGINAVNTLDGYREIAIATPEEVNENEENDW